MGLSVKPIHWQPTGYAPLNTLLFVLTGNAAEQVTKAA